MKLAFGFWEGFTSKGEAQTFCLSFTCRSPIAHLSLTSRRTPRRSPIVHLSFTYRSPIAHLASHPTSRTCR